MADLIPYVIRQGDYMTKLAHTCGFDVDEVWNDSKNDAIRALRPDKDILAPGDIVYLPKEPKPGLDFTKEATNKFKATVPKVEVTITFMDPDGPFANEPFEVQGLERPGEGAATGGPKDERTTDGDGKATLSVPVTVREVVAFFPKRNTAFAIRVGDMDPEDETTGIKKRLANLGYLPPDLSKDAESEYLPSAIRSFQKDQGLTITGTLDDATIKALKAAHKQ